MLVVDIGNTHVRYKAWNNAAVCGSGKIQHNQIHELADYLPGFIPAKLVIANVGPPEVCEQLRNLFPGAHYVAIVSRPQFGRVINGYSNPETLGVDRWLAVVEAYYQSGMKACAIFDWGTALTLDVIDESGQHQGGYIVPGMAMMRRALISGTEGVRFQLSVPGISFGYGVDTRQAVENGTSGLVLAWILAEIEKFRMSYADGVVFVTGGMAAAIKPLLPAWVLLYEDLVLDGMKRIGSI